MPSPTAKLLLPVALIAATAARADDSNFRPYVVGSRAAGMGGAFTALADDGSGPFYNPGGIAFVDRSQLSIAGSVYGIVSGNIEDLLHVGTERHDFSFSNLNIFPTATGGVWRMDDGSRADSAEVLSLGVFVPDAINIDARDRIVSQQNAVTLIEQEQTVWVGVTYARRFGRVGVGASLFGLLGTSVDQLDLTVASSATEFGIVTRRIDETRYGVVGALGVRWDPTDALRLGLSVYTPALGFGTRRVFTRFAVATPQATPASAIAVVNADDLHATPTDPWRLQGGVAWSSGRFTLAADLIYLAPRDVVDDADRTAPFADASVSLERHVVRNGVLDAALGAEYLVGDRIPLRAGIFTDFAASPSSSTTSDVQNSTHINRFGGSASIGYRTEHTATDLGVTLSGGSGQSVVFGQNIDFSTNRVTGTSEFLFYVFLATAYEF